MNRFLTFVVIFTFWLFWSGMFDPFHVALGIISSAIVVQWTGRLFVETSQPLSRRLMEWVRFEAYAVWLLWQIVLANIQVFKLAFHPNLLRVIHPRLISFKTNLKGDVAKFILAQSITLTPGTVTVRINGNQFDVHAINNDAATGVPGPMENKIANIYKGSIHG